MSDKTAASGHTVDREGMRRQILAFFQREIQDRRLVLTLDMPTDAVTIDSIDIARVLFRVEELYGGEILLTADAPFQTVGDLVDAVIDSLHPTD